MDSKEFERIAGSLRELERLCVVMNFNEVWGVLGRVDMF